MVQTLEFFTIADLPFKEPDSLVIFFMEPSLFSVLTKKIITTIISVGSLFYSTIPGVNAHLSDIQLSAQGEQLLLSCRLENCFSEELDQIFRSGKEIKIHFKAELVDAQTNKPLRDTTFYHSIHYSVLDEVFDVYYSESDRLYSNLYLDEAKKLLTEITAFRMIAADQITPEETYLIHLEAWMDKMKFQGMEEPLNLMFYWNSIHPSRRSTTFTLELFAK